MSTERRGGGRTSLVEKVERGVGRVVPFEVRLPALSRGVGLHEQRVPALAQDPDREHAHAHRPAQEP